METTPKNVMWKDGFYYLHKQSGASDELCRGMIHGVITGMMSFGMSFETAIGMLKGYIINHDERDDFRPIEKILPECWMETYYKA